MHSTRYTSTSPPARRYDAFGFIADQPAWIHEVLVHELPKKPSFPHITRAARAPINTAPPTTSDQQQLGPSPLNTHLDDIYHQYRPRRSLTHSRVVPGDAFGLRAADCAREYAALVEEPESGEEGDDESESGEEGGVKAGVVGRGFEGYEGGWETDVVKLAVLRRELEVLFEGQAFYIEEPQSLATSGASTPALVPSCGWASPPVGICPHPEGKCYWNPAVLC